MRLCDFIYFDASANEQRSFCIICLITFWTLIVGSDVLKKFKIGDEHIDMNKWRREKYYGKSEKAETTKNIRK